MEKVYVATSPTKDKPKDQIWIPEHEGPNLREVNEFRFFRNKKITYVWDPEAHLFFDLKMLDNNVPLSYYHTQNGLSKEEQLSR